jgi:hypothetical protein
MSDKNIARAEEERILQKGQRRLYIADVIWVLRVPIFFRSGVAWVLGVVWVCAQTIGDRCESGDWEAGRFAQDLFRCFE